jgi:hypothetical protein
MILFNINESPGICHRINNPGNVQFDLNASLDMGNYFSGANNFGIQDSGSFTNNINIESHINETPVASFNLNDFYGTFLTVPDFFLDDLAFTVRSDFSLVDNVVISEGNRQITFPSGAPVMVAKPITAFGSMEEHWDTTIITPSGTFVIPRWDGFDGGNSPKPLLLNEIYRMNAEIDIPIFDYDTLNFTSLKERGFVNPANEDIVEFKLVHIRFGGGGVRLFIDISPC